jgi:YD repeat-containing protein
VNAIWLHERHDWSLTQPIQCLVQYGYHYDHENHVLLASITDAEGATETFEYLDTLVTKTTQKDGFSYYFQWDDEVDPRKSKCIKTWGGEGDVPHFYRELTFEEETKTCHVLDGRGTVETYVGNAHGFVDKIINPNGDETCFGYDDDGLLVSRLDAVGETVFEYDHFGRLIIEMAPDQSETLYMYTHKGVQPAHVDYGAVQSVHTADGAQHRYQRDTHDEISEYTDPENRKVRFIRDATTGLLQATRDAQGQGARLYWDEFQQLSAIEYPQGGREHFQYDLKGRVVEYRKDDLVTQYRYNGNDQCISAKRSDGVHQYWSYTPAGHLASHTRADGSTVQWLYHGGVVYRRINPDGTQFDYQYDTDHNLVGLINERGETYRLEYDENERLVKEVGFDGRTQAYHYNELGQLSQWIDQDRTVDLKRDKLNRVIQATYQQSDNEQGQTSEKQQVQFAYDPLGRLVKAQNEQRTLQYRYNLVVTRNLLGWMAAIQ